MRLARLPLLVATTNRGKLREVAEVLSRSPFELVGLGDFPDIVPVEETGATFEENACLKARYYCRLTKCWTLADDSGLCVDALDGAPGVHSARFAGVPSSDSANNHKLVSALRDVPPERRTARFVCALALARPDGDPTIVAQTRGVIEGLIIDEPRGANGFGYDPHFYIPDLRKTAAELPPETKNAVSHRGQALRALAPLLGELMELQT